MKNGKRSSLVGSLIYIGIGVISLAAYFMDKYPEKFRLFSGSKKRKLCDNENSQEGPEEPSII